MKGELTAGVAWTAVGLYIAVTAYRLGIGSAGEPGPGLLAFLLGMVMVVLGSAEAIRSGVKIAYARGDETDRASWPWRMTALAAALLLYIAALTPVGFPLATFVFLVALILAFGDLSWPRAVVLSASLSAVTYALFKFGLGVQLPAGLLG